MNDAVQSMMAALRMVQVPWMVGWKQRGPLPLKTIFDETRDYIFTLCRDYDLTMIFFSADQWGRKMALRICVRSGEGEASVLALEWAFEAESALTD